MMRAVVRMGEHLWRPLTDSDADAAFVVSLRNDERFRRMFYTSEATIESHKRFIRAADERDEINWLIERDGAPVGVSGIYNFDFANRKAEFGRVAALDPRIFHLNWIVSAYVAMDTIGINKAYIETLEENTIIARGVARLGMVHEGTLRAHVIRDGVPLNVHIYSNTFAEWDAMRARHTEKFGTPQILSFEGRKMNREAVA
jgi:RimJ/RimL family protein N-acetyltransferase